MKLRARCSDCGNSLDGGERFCRMCGRQARRRRFPTGPLVAVVILVSVGGAAAAALLLSTTKKAESSLPAFRQLEPSTAIELEVRPATPDEIPLQPAWVSGSLLWEFSASAPPGPVEIRVPLPAAEIAMLVHYTEDGLPESVPFTVRDGVAVAVVDQLSPIGWLETTHDSIEDWLEEHTIVDWLLGGEGRGNGCENVHPGVELSVDGNAELVTACAEDGRAGVELVVRNARRFYIDAYPSPVQARVRGGLPFTCCDEGGVLGPAETAAWSGEGLGTRALAVEATFNASAFRWTTARLVAAPLFTWAGGDESLIAAVVQEIAAADAMSSLLANVMGDDPNWATAARDLARLLSDPDWLAAIADELVAEGVFSQAGIHVTAGALKTLLVVPTVGAQVRTTADLIAAALEGGAAARVTYRAAGDTSPAATTTTTAVQAAPAPPRLVCGAPAGLGDGGEGDETAQFDLDGDGEVETISMRYMPRYDQAGGLTSWDLDTEISSGSTRLYGAAQSTDHTYDVAPGSAIAVLDMDGDGVSEVVFCDYSAAGQYWISTIDVVAQDRTIWRRVLTTGASNAEVRWTGSHLEIDDVFNFGAGTCQQVTTTSYRLEARAVEKESEEVRTNHDPDREFECDSILDSRDRGGSGVPVESGEDAVALFVEYWLAGDFAAMSVPAAAEVVAEARSWGPADLIFYSAEECLPGSSGSGACELEVVLPGGGHALLFYLEHAVIGGRHLVWTLEFRGDLG